MNYYDKYLKYKNKYLHLKYNSKYNQQKTDLLYSYDNKVFRNSNNDIKLKNGKIYIKYKKYNHTFCVTKNTAKEINLYDDSKKIINIPNPKEYILYHDKRVRDMCVKLRKIERYYYDKFVESRKKYDKLFKQSNKDFYYEKTSVVDLHKMYPDYKYLYENIKEKNDFIDLRLKLNNVLKQLLDDENNCFFITPDDIKNFDKSKFSNFTNSSFMLHKENTTERLLTVSKAMKEDKNNLVSNYDNLMYMFKNALKDNSRYCKGEFNKLVQDNIVKRLYGFNKVNVFYHFMIFFQELHRITELTNKELTIKELIINNIKIKIKKENRLLLIKNIDNIRTYFFKEYSKDFKDKTELLDTMYVIDYIIYSMDVVYDDIECKLKKGGVYMYIMSIIKGYKSDQNDTFEEYLDTILKSSKEEKKVYIPLHRRNENTESKNNNFIKFATLFVDNVCPMELIISIDQIKEYYYNYGCKEIFNINTNNDYNNDFVKKYNMNFYKYYNHLKDNFINIKKNFYDNDKKFYDRITKDLININNRPLILGTNKTYFFTSLCGTKFLVKPWMYIFNKKLSWDISLNKWMVSCLLKRKNIIKSIIIHKNLTNEDKYKGKKVYMRISMFNERKELNLEMKNFIGCMIHKLKDETTKKFYISYLFNKKGNINYYNFRSSQLYPKDVLAEAYKITYMELNTLLYYYNDMGEKLHFYLYKDNLILISSNPEQINKKYKNEIIELQLIKTDTLKDFIFIKK